MEGNRRRTGKSIRTHELRKYHCIRRRKRRHKQFPEYTGENGSSKSGVLDKLPIGETVKGIINPDSKTEEKPVTKAEEKKDKK